jgi:iron complex transport system ATP-binding protein
VTLGRNPHLGRFTSAEGPEDRRIVDDALAHLDLLDLGRRHATELSGGELQRVVLARAIAQQPRVLLLDEPTTALDIGHQQEVLDIVDRLRADAGITVLCALHDLTLAAQYAHRLVLLDHGRVREDGAPADVLDARLLSDVYRARVEVLDHPGGPVVLPVRGTPS